MLGHTRKLQGYPYECILEHCAGLEPFKFLVDKGAKIERINEWYCGNWEKDSYLDVLRFMHEQEPSIFFKNYLPNDNMFETALIFSAPNVFKGFLQFFEKPIYSKREINMLFKREKFVLAEQDNLLKELKEQKPFSLNQNDNEYQKKRNKDLKEKIEIFKEWFKSFNKST